MITSLRPLLRVRLEYRGNADDEQLTLPDAAAPVDEVAYSVSNHFNFKMHIRPTFLSYFQIS